jgi:hypothetical protein
VKALLVSKLNIFMTRKAKPKLYPITEKMHPKLQKLKWVKSWFELGSWSWLIQPLQGSEYGLKEGYVEYKDKTTGRGYSSVETQVLVLTEKGKDFLNSN